MDGSTPGFEMKLAFLTFFTLFGLQVFAEATVTKGGYVSLKTVQSNEWSCRYVQKNIIQGPADLKVAPFVCKASVYCNGVAGEPLKRRWGRRFVLSCSAKSHNICPSLEKCAVESASDSLPIVRENAELLDEKTDSISDGRKCEYKSKDTGTISFWVKDGKSAGHFCGDNAYCTSPDGTKTQTLASCPAVQVNQDGEATRYACPRANDCLSKHIGTPGYTEQELAQMEKHQASSSAPATHRP